jgi:transcriptional regulator with XRE-family HTH domain
MPPRHPRHPFNAYSSETDRHTGLGAAMQKRKKIAKAEEIKLLKLTNTMGNRITQAMEDNDLSISWIAQQMGVVDRTVSDWRKDGNVSTHRIPLLAEYLSCSVQYLMTGGQESSLQQRTEHADVLQFERHLAPDSVHGAPKTLLTRYVPIYEMDEVVGKDPDKFVSGLQTFTDQPQERTSIAITLNPEQVGAPGIPRFCFQFLVNYIHGFKRGDYVAYATDLIPSRGKFILVAFREKGSKEAWDFANGYFTLYGSRQVTSVSMAKDMESYGNFVLKIHPDERHVDDVYISADKHEWKLLGTATYRAEWLDYVQVLRQTGLSERLDTVYEGRRRT